MRFFKNKYNSFCTSLIERKYCLPLEGKDNYFVPQGVCVIDDFTLVSCYDALKLSNSILYLFNGDFFCKLIKLDCKIHAGGICYHKKSKSLFITGKGEGDISFVNRYDVNKLLNLKDNSSIFFEAKYKVDSSGELYSSAAHHSSPAYLTCFDDELYVGNFCVNKDANKNIIKKFRILSNGDLSSISEKIDNPFLNTQGLSVIEYQSVKYFVFSRSFGRGMNSIINVCKMEKGHFVDVARLVLPSMLEQVNIYDKDKLLVVFESGAKIYRQKAITVDCMLSILDFSEMLKCNDSKLDFYIGSKMSLFLQRKIRINRVDM